MFYILTVLILTVLILTVFILTVLILIVFILTVFILYSCANINGHSLSHMTVQLQLHQLPGYSGQWAELS